MAEEKSRKKFGRPKKVLDAEALQKAYRLLGENIADGKITLISELLGPGTISARQLATDAGIKYRPFLRLKSFPEEASVGEMARIADLLSIDREQIIRLCLREMKRQGK